VHLKHRLLFQNVLIENTLTLGLGEGRTLSALFESFFIGKTDAGVLVVMVLGCTTVWFLGDGLAFGTGFWIREIKWLGSAFKGLPEVSCNCPIIHAFCLPPRNASAVEFDLSKSLAEVCWAFRPPAFLLGDGIPDIGEPECLSIDAVLDNVAGHLATKALLYMNHTSECSHSW